MIGSLRPASHDVHYAGESCRPDRLDRANGVDPSSRNGRSKAHCHGLGCRCAVAFRIVCSCKPDRALDHRFMVGTCHGAAGAWPNRCVRCLACAKAHSAWREIPRAFYHVLSLVHHYALGHSAALLCAEYFRDHASCTVINRWFSGRKRPGNKRLRQTKYSLQDGLKN